jgi:3-phosphoshikimate 1-carboxyvinyltransferase
VQRLKVLPTEQEVFGTIPVPPSKYHLHRALILGAMAEGVTRIHGRSQARHIGDTLRALHDLGVRVSRTEDGYAVHGGPWHPRTGRVRVGSSGSTLQFLLGLGCRSDGEPVTYDGIEALRRRPIGPLLDGLNAIGIETEAQARRLPVTVTPGQPAGGSVRMQGTLSQWISGLLMAAPLAREQTTVEILDPYNERTYIALTVSFLRAFGIEVTSDDGFRVWRVPPNQTYRATEVHLDADLSSAAFPLVYACLHHGLVQLTHVTGASNHPEGRILDVLRTMGAPMEVDERGRRILVRNTGQRLRASDIDMQDMPDLIPILSVCASLAQGRTILRNIGPGRFKESNRVKAMLQLRKMGARIEEVDDTLVIDGVERLVGADVSSYNDHRVLMAFAVAASRASGATRITFPNAYRISYPEFRDHMATLGLHTEIESSSPSRASRELSSVGAL